MERFKSGGRILLQVNLQSFGNNESYQERLARLEGDKESLVLQVRHILVCVCLYVCLCTCVCKCICFCMFESIVFAFCLNVY